MKTITMQDLKKHGAGVVSDSGPTYLVVNSKIKSVLVPLEDYEMQISAIEELEDIKDILSRNTEDSVSFDTAVNEIENGISNSIQKISNKRGSKTT